MDSLQQTIERLEAEIKKFRSRRSQSDPTFRTDLKELQEELEFWKNFKDRPKQNKEQPK
jgi:hypothetical protein